MRFLFTFKFIYYTFFVVEIANKKCREKNIEFDLWTFHCVCCASVHIRFYGLDAMKCVKWNLLVVN